MPAFRVLSPERSLEIIQAWINVSWPLSSAQAASIAADLGWAADENNPGAYFSELSSANEADCGFGIEGNFANRIHFPLSLLADEKEKHLSWPAIANTVSRIEKTIILQHGKPKKSVSPEGIIIDEWILGSGASFHIGYDELAVDVSVLSPEVTELINDPAGDPNPDKEW
ncbi:DUF6301 family protein [Buchananella hordeovulneris]|uniref:DUF6301 family protein n=1 Tax=Buchananella hordeovulneris TaxID=52770 RepID=UPI000F600BEC|nr:DUF6301 family protein [Buchananella hordeovulneris]RRD41638.1 hypothetical protein EII13_10945 [Buchananella hordeovulneris]RRD49491.1 hypothetical protein EII12_10480 [Buchananella hordeovulneris]